MAYTRRTLIQRNGTADWFGIGSADRQFGRGQCDGVTFWTPGIVPY